MSKRIFAFVYESERSGVSEVIDVSGKNDASAQNAEATTRAHCSHL